MTVATGPGAPVTPDGATPPRRSRRARGLLVVLAVLAVALAVPAIVPFTVQTADGDRVCIPVVDGWADELDRPADIDLREYATNEAEMRRYDPEGAYRVETYLDWVRGPGACVPQSRDRLRPVGRLAGLIPTVLLIVFVLRSRD